MAKESYLMVLFYTVLVIFFAVNQSSVNGGRLQLKNQIMKMSSFIHTSTHIASTKKERKRILSRYGEGIHIPIKSGSNGNFLVNIGFGTPENDFPLLFDTGSDITWIRCQPCSSNCNPQISTFNPSSSSTFSTINTSITTRYYNDGTSYTGYFVKDTLTLVSDEHRDFIFVCAQQVKGNFEGASGLLGLSKGKFSVIAQTDSDLFSTFCYCLPATSASSGYLVFGVQAFESCQPETEKFIPIEEVPGNNGLTAYYISFTGITIGETRIDIPSIGPSSSIQAIIDSGTVISRLPSFLYSALKLEFEAIMSGFNMTESPEPDLFDTCYNLENQISGWTPPVIVLHFGGMDVELDSSAATTTGKSESEICLAFTGNKDKNDLVIIGNQQHRYRDLFFDVHNKNLYFSSRRCMNI